MKKRNFLLVLVALLAVSCLLTGCGKDDTIAYVSYNNNYEVLQTYYYVGDEIELNGQKICYYQDIKNANPVEKDIVITNDMISNFSTQKAGEFVFKINYKNASKEVVYYVYEKPDITTSYGFYKSSILGKNIVAEIKENQIVLNYYENGVADFGTTEPTSAVTVNSKIKAGVNGNLNICFVYEDSDYKFCDFENGIPTRVQITIKTDDNVSSMKSMCTKISTNI